MKVVFSRRFRAEPDDLERYIAQRSSDQVAFAYIDRLIAAAEALNVTPRRCRLPPELGPEVRTLPFDGAYQVAYRVGNETVTAIALFGPGQTLTSVEDIP